MVARCPAPQDHQPQQTAPWGLRGWACQHGEEALQADEAQDNPAHHLPLSCPSVCYQVCCRGVGSWTRGPGCHLISEKGFSGTTGLRDKRPSVHPSVPSPGLLEQHSFMRPPRPPRPPPLHTASFQAASMLGLFVCGAERRPSVVLLCSPPMHPPSTPSLGKTGPGHWRRTGR